MVRERQSSDRHRRGRPSGSFLERHPGARLATGALCVALVIGLATFWAWLPTQTEICVPGEPNLAACRTVVPGVVAAAVGGIPSTVALIWMTVQDRRSGK